MHTDLGRCKFDTLVLRGQLEWSIRVTMSFQGLGTAVFNCCIYPECPSQQLISIRSALQSCNTFIITLSYCPHQIDRNSLHASVRNKPENWSFDNVKQQRYSVSVYISKLSLNGMITRPNLWHGLLLQELFCNFSHDWLPRETTMEYHWTANSIWNAFENKLTSYFYIGSQGPSQNIHDM